MTFSFELSKSGFPSLPGVVFLKPSSWDDYSFKTSFDVIISRSLGERVHLGTVKIGYISQQHGRTAEKLPEQFNELPEDFFSLGQDVAYYKTCKEKLSQEELENFLTSLHDIAFNEKYYSSAENEAVFRSSITRDIGTATIKNQFRRVLSGNPELTDFNFSYVQKENKKTAELKLNFEVKANSTPSTNVHVLIGRNGVGKTTLLNSMVSTLMGDKSNRGATSNQFTTKNILSEEDSLPIEYFSAVASVSFSAFDAFIPPPDRQDYSLGPGFFYIGMKKTRSNSSSTELAMPKTSSELKSDLITSFKSCISQSEKRERWRKAVAQLESDPNFSALSLKNLLNVAEDKAIGAMQAAVSEMSSGHSVVLLTITKLVDTVQEKTLVLIDEPESHLHPPLLSAFMRALSNLLHDRNGVAIIATHSPVVLQEVPRSCAWKLTRIGSQGRADRPERETFGENVGVLTREVFGLEVSKSGFHEMLERSVNQGKSFEEILATYDGQLGAEAKAILLTLLASRDRGEHWR